MYQLFIAIPLFALAAVMFGLVVQAMHQEGMERVRRGRK